jgi:glycine/D-amino acid oxidase-like deaminating enzyme
LIVGGGFTGLWTALSLKERRPSLVVALIEADRCGAGASGKNGGKVHGYWTALPRLAAQLGDDSALAIARSGAEAQDALRRFAGQAPLDVWWREAGSLTVSAAPAQDRALVGAVETAARLGVEDQLRLLDAGEVQQRCASPVFRAGLLYAEGATLHPPRLARALRARALACGVLLHEATPMTALEPGSGHHPDGRDLGG